MRLVDAHCHLESEELLPQLDAVLAEAKAAGLVRLVTASVAPEQWQVSADIASRFDAVEFALGIHPLYVEPQHTQTAAVLLEACERGAVAIGEIGLDKKGDSPDWTLQREIFEAQLRIAKAINLPVVLHCRGAYAELLRSVGAVGLSERGGVIHAFSGTPEDAEACINMGLRISLGGTLTCRNSKKREAVLRRAYPDHLLIETDSPDMSPVEQHGRPNVPANILFNLRAAAEILREPEERIAECTTRNAVALFELEL